jgi:hypothetical protein
LLHNNPEECSFQLLHGGSPKSCRVIELFLILKISITNFLLAHFCDKRKCGTVGRTLETIKKHPHTPVEFYEVVALPSLLNGSEIC